MGSLIDQWSKKWSIINTLPLMFCNLPIFSRPGDICCTDGSTCFRKSNKCDGTKQCNNGYDEEGCPSPGITIINQSINQSINQCKPV